MFKISILQVRSIPNIAALAALVCFLLLPLPSSGHAADAEMTLAGFAFAGQFGDAPKRYPYTYKIFKRLQGANSLSAHVLRRSKNINNPAFEIRPFNSLLDLKERDRALMAVLLLTDEVVSTENYGRYHKTFINLRGDVFIFDYKNQVVVRTYPLNTVLFDATPTAPGEKQILAFVENMLLTESESGLISLFAQKLAAASLPQEGTRTIQIRNVEVTPESLAMMPPALREFPQSGAAERMIADMFASELSTQTGVPLMPSSIGHAVGGVMTMCLEDGNDMRLKVDDGDYLFDLKLNRLVKVKTSENKIGTAYVYGAYASVRFYEPTLNSVFINADFKNGESAVVPIAQVAADDFPGYQDAIRGLFRKFSASLQDPRSPWARTATGAKDKDIASQLKAANDILRRCK